MRAVLAIATLASLVASASAADIGIMGFTTTTYNEDDCFEDSYIRWPSCHCTGELTRSFREEGNKFDTGCIKLEKTSGCAWIDVFDRDLEGALPNCWAELYADSSCTRDTSYVKMDKFGLAGMGGWPRVYNAYGYEHSQRYTTKPWWNSMRAYCT